MVAIKYFALSLIILLIFASGCSTKENDPSVPANYPGESLLEIASGNRNSDHVLLGIWSIDYNLPELSAEIRPLREAGPHYNITDMLIPPACNNCITLKVNSFNPVSGILDVSVTLYNPFNLTGHDVRGILFTDDAGHELRNPEAWTPLWDIPGGDTINPFISFHGYYPPFSPKMKATRKYLVYIPKPPQYNSITFAVDVSWPGNCKEPYSIYGFKQDVIYAKKGSCGTVSIQVNAWQNDVDKVLLYAPEIAGVDPTQLYSTGDNLWGYVLTNQMGALPGYYKAKIAATSAGSSDLALYNYVEILITEEPPFNLADVTPPWLNFQPQEICNDGNYVYVTSFYLGLHIFDISDPANPGWVNKVDIPGWAGPVAVSGGYAYVACDNVGVIVIDVDPPEFASIVKIVTLYGDVNDVAVSGKYAYVANGYAGLKIIDVSLPESSHLVKNVNVGSSTSSDYIAVTDGYAYVGTVFGGSLAIIDIDPVETASVINQIYLSTTGQGIYVSQGYAYIASAKGLYIIDIDPPEAAYAIKSVYTSQATGVSVLGSQAYVADQEMGLVVIDVSIPELSNIVKIIETPGRARRISLSPDYAYIGDIEFGLVTIDIDPLDSAHIVDIDRSPGWLFGLAIYDHYVYTISGYMGLMIIDVDPAIKISVVGSIETYSRYIQADNGYVYVPNYEKGLQIIDVQQPDAPYIYKTIDTIIKGSDVAISQGYAYIPSYPPNLAIVDIDPVESAFVLNNFNPGYSISKIAVSNGYAYMTGGSKFITADIDPPLSAHYVASLQLPHNLGDVAVNGNYAYVINDYSDSLYVIDVSKPNFPYVVREIVLDGDPNGVITAGNYAYVSNRIKGLHVLNISLPEEAYLVKTFPILGDACGVAVSDEYVYVATAMGGLRILEIQ